jgi:hypothetical protein
VIILFFALISSPKGKEFSRSIDKKGNNGSNVISNGSVVSDMIRGDAITSTKIADNAVTAYAIADDSINVHKLGTDVYPIIQRNSTIIYEGIYGDYDEYYNTNGSGNTSIVASHTGKCFITVSGYVTLSYATDLYSVGSCLVGANTITCEWSERHNYNAYHIRVRKNNLIIQSRMFALFATDGKNPESEDYASIIPTSAIIPYSWTYSTDVTAGDSIMLEQNSAYRIHNICELGQYYPKQQHHLHLTCLIFPM